MDVNDREVCLQINLHPLDAPHAVHTLPHQMRALGPQVDEIQLTLDLHLSQGSRYRTTDYPEKLKSLRQTIDRICAEHPKAYVVEVDYAEQTARQVARAFLGGDFIPMRAENGSPFYAYLFGMYSARSPHVLHLDSDMLFGGGSLTWVREAVAKLAEDRQLLTCNPLPGPPTADGSLRSQQAERVPAPYPAFRFHSLSTRVCLLDTRRFRSGELRVPLLNPGLSKRLQCYVNYTPPYLALEDSLGALMVERGLSRLDFLGNGPGLWTLHPVHRSPRFYQELPHLIARIEAGDVPEAQRGDYNINDSMFDWSEVRAALTWKRKVRRRLEYAAAGIAGRMRDLRS
ncbi:capsular biosynthesis protein [Eleftheria terrae]|uniref:capsular biosynthesis protein n=1 Tax=Eleftheria terrae TaxID=1597781 RepID=UPI00263B20FA|nr:capsular biosynthesis protein [Eleftheria terrae]WKB54672.1 capsular biosynthesis protein [Eleftheria terrae]